MADNNGLADIDVDKHRNVQVRFLRCERFLDGEGFAAVIAFRSYCVPEECWDKECTIEI